MRNWQNLEAGCDLEQVCEVSGQVLLLFIKGSLLGEKQM